MRLTADTRQAWLELRRPGQTDAPGAVLWRFGRILTAAAIVVTNVIGAAVVVVMATVVIPEPALHDVGHVRTVNVVAAAVYVGLAVPFGVLIGIAGLRRLRDWLVADRPATPLEVRVVLRAPLRLFVVQVAIWAVATITFAVLDGRYSTTLGLRVAAGVALTGLSTAACAYLLTERLLRPAAARAFATGTPERLAIPGVALRAVLAWALGTGVPVAGLLMIGSAALEGGRSSNSQLSVAMVVLGAIALTVGLLAISLAARATADPVDSVRRGLAQVQTGDLTVSLPVYDGTQLGKLQLGFNRMVGGLVERERMRETLGVYLDPDVAEQVVSAGTNLEGEEVEVTVMFVDVRNFTSFSEGRPADQVVAVLNRLFGRVVPLIQEQGGRIDKYVGDGLLAVFGAPRKYGDHADRAVAAAVAMASAVDEPGAENDVRIGIGINSGRVVAGNVGAAGRLEFTVIGDVVNTAARVEAATRSTGDTVLIAEGTKALLRRDWPDLVRRPAIPLPGKSDPVALYGFGPSPEEG